MSDKLSSRTIIDAALLIAPLNHDNPAGAYLKYEPIYGQIREARREEDSNLSQGIWKIDFKKADWPVVEKLCLDVLSTQSKDLQIIAWLIEAWTVMDQFLGFGKGLFILASLCKSCWNDIHPIIEEDSETLEQRFSLFEWMDTQFSSRVMFIPFTYFDHDLTLSGFTLADWLSANNLEMLAKRSADGKNLLTQAENKGGVTLARFRKSLDLTSLDYLEGVMNQILLAQEVLESLCRFLQMTLGSQAPAFGKLKKNIEDITRVIKTSCEQKHQKIAETDKLDRLEELPADVFLNQLDEQIFSPSSLAKSDVVTISERQDAYKALKDIGEFLKSFDAHSPAPYLLDLIVSWENKTLVEILVDVNKGDKEGHVLLRLISNTLQTPSVKAG